jgi:hypothetical protein
VKGGARGSGGLSLMGLLLICPEVDEVTAWLGAMTRRGDRCDEPVVVEVVVVKASKAGW